MADPTSKEVLVSSDISKDVYIGSTSVTTGAEIDNDDEKLTIHYIFSINKSYGERIKTELDLFWTRETSNVEYRKPTDRVECYHLPNISKLKEYWNKMGTYEVSAPKVWNPFSEEFNLFTDEKVTYKAEIGIVIVITHGLYGDGCMYIDEGGTRNEEKLFESDVKAGYNTKTAFLPSGESYKEERILIFDTKDYEDLEMKTLDTLINLSCHSATFEKDNIMKKLLKRCNTKYALGVDGVSVIRPQGPRNTGNYNYYYALNENNGTDIIECKGFVNFVNGKGSGEKLLNQDMATAIITLMDWTRGRKKARTSEDIKKK